MTVKKEMRIGKNAFWSGGGSKKKVKYCGVKGWGKRLESNGGERQEHSNKKKNSSEGIAPKDGINDPKLPLSEVNVLQEVRADSGKSRKEKDAEK